MNVSVFMILMYDIVVFSNCYGHMHDMSPNDFI